MATESEVATKMQFDLLAEEIKALHAMETWGTSLLLTAIALLTKQIIDWSIPVAPATVASYRPGSYLLMLPAVLGLVAFLFLRTINFRIRRARKHQYKKADAQDNRKWWSWGLVGWFMALMPLSLGLGASWYLSTTNPEIATSMSIALWASGFALIYCAIVFVLQTLEKLGNK